MRTQRIWIQIAILGSAVALALALFLATVGVVAGLAEGPAESQQQPSHAEKPSPAAPQQVFEGMITCSRCGAKHSPALQRPATTCVRVCVHGGAEFELVGGDSTYLLTGNSDGLKRLAGQRARIVGNLSGTTIKVRSVSAEM